jgi:WD40 repeat protein
MRSDAKNRFVTTISKEGTIQVWNEKVFLEEGPRKVMQNTLKDYHFEITCFDLSEKYSMMVTGEKQPNIKVWDYESCKLCHIIELESASCSIRISDAFPILAIACIN